MSSNGCAEWAWLSSCRLSLPCAKQMRPGPWLPTLFCCFQCPSAGSHEPSWCSLGCSRAGTGRWGAGPHPVLQSSTHIAELGLQHMQCTVTAATRVQRESLAGRHNRFIERPCACQAQVDNVFLTSQKDKWLVPKIPRPRGG